MAAARPLPEMQADRNLVVRNSWGELKIDRESFRQSTWTCPIFAHPSLFADGFEWGRQLALKRPQIERRLIDGDFPVVSPILDPRSDDFVESPDPPFSEDGAGNRPRDLIDLETNELVVDFAAHEARARRNLFKNDHRIKFRNRHACIDGRDALSQSLFVFSGKRPDRVINFP